ncbi:YncE family protein [Antrihabitans cavernicola]|uniref:YncE family protein n=1 Tax=Antrihabitans cavernicola TaxID=2495913 RepID=A0A5A7SIH5_9NOCA|nr:YncE family protein [Spelaeibacter cavernicola]KAA0024403.1 YncE family protein [Spelaeibacter cavernicola]
MLAAACALLVGSPTGAGAAPVGGPAGDIYIPEVDSDNVAVMDAATSTMKQQIPIKTDLGPSRPAVTAKSPDGSKIYVDNFGAITPSISIIDRRANTTKNMRVESIPLGIFTSGDGKEIFIPEVGFVVEVLDIATEKIVRKLRFLDVPTGAISGPDGVMYVTFGTGLIGGYDPKTGAQVRPKIWSGGLAPFWFSITKDGSKMYTDAINSIGVIDMKSWTLTKTIATWPDNVGRLSNPGAFTSEISPDGSKLYVALFGGTGVMVFDTKTDRYLHSIPTQGYVIGMTFSGDGSRGYISDSGPSSNGIPGPPGEYTTFFNMVTVGVFSPGQMITFDTADDHVVTTTPTGLAPGVPVWVPDL